MSAEADLWPSEAWSSAADVDLLAQARDGSAEAYGELWRRHLPAAYAVAARHRSRAAPEDIVAEASARVLDLIRRGKGPEEHFRAYFLSTVRTVATDHVRRDLRVVPAEAEQLEVLAEPVTEVFGADELDSTLVREAFAGLSERDQRVLWHTTVEGEAPRAVAPRLGLSANAVSARAMRAREALRARYLDSYSQRSAGMADSDECRWAIEHLGAHVRGRLPKRQADLVRRHLDSCTTTAELAAELEHIRSSFPALLVPLVLLAGVSTPGFVSAGALGALGAGAATAGLGSRASQASPPDTVGHLTSHLTTLAAGFAIGVGVVGAGASVPAAPGVALQTPAGSAPAQTVPPAPQPPVAAPTVSSSAPLSVADALGARGSAPVPRAAAVGPQRVVRPPGQAPPTSAIVTRPVAPALVAPAPVVPVPTTMVPAPTSSPTATGTATPTTTTPVPPTTSPAPTSTTPVPTRTQAPSLVIGWDLLRQRQPEVRLTFRGPDGKFVPVSVVVMSGSEQVTLEQHSKRHDCVVDGKARTLTCTINGPAPLVVRELGVEAFQPLIVTARTADGETATVTIRAR
jgi:RNA polymerase sigma factor (sigma-70 family)